MFSLLLYVILCTIPEVNYQKQKHIYNKEVKENNL